MLGLLAVVVAAGTATTGAGPHAGGQGAKRLPIALEDMARIHSGLVIGLVALTIALLYLLDHTERPGSVLDRARLLLGAMVVQGGIGYAQYFTHLPALLVGVHVFGATVVWMAMLWFYDGLTHRGPVARMRPADSDAAAMSHAVVTEAGSGRPGHGARSAARGRRHPGRPMTGPGTEVQPVEVDAPRGRRGRPPRPAVAGDRLERPDQPHVLRHLRLPEALRLQPRTRPPSSCSTCTTRAGPW